MEKKTVELSDSIQNVSWQRLAEEFGTPLYIYDAQKILTRLKDLQTAFADSQAKVKYAIKALSNISVLKLLKRHGAGADAVSVNEIKLALLAGFVPQDIVYTPSCADFDEISEAVALGVTVNLDSLPMLEQFGEKFGGNCPCGLRLNPNIQAGGNYKISTGHGGAKFGISVSQFAQATEIVKKYSMRAEGLHIHTGSDIAEAEVYLKMADVFFGLARTLPDLRFLDFGGGFKVAYKSDEKPADVDDLGVKLGKALADFCRSYGRPLELWMEPGKYLVSEAGFLLVKCTLVKPTPSLTFAGVNSGLNHLIRPMMYGAWHDIANISNPTGALKTYTVVGNICETDTFGADRLLNEVRVGDLLVIKNAGAYGYSMSSQFNSRLRPAEALIENGEARLIRRRDVFEDLIRGQTEA